MDKLLLVFMGGGLGSAARYGVGTLYGRVGLSAWPYGTLTVNIVGGFLMGLLATSLALKGGADQEKWRVLFGVGVLGGFTTFSAFSLEAALMIERRQFVQAGGYVALSIVLSIAALFAGMLVMRKVLG
jgi:CrcB protein